MHLRNFTCFGIHEVTIIINETMKIKSILISQPQPENTSSYSKLTANSNLKVDFRPFIHVEGMNTKEVRLQKIDFSQFTAVILTSRNAVDHYFRLAEEMRYKVPSTMKYFCQSEAIAHYLQRYIVYRKRKIFVGERHIDDLLSYFQKYPEEKYMLPTSNVMKDTIPNKLDEFGINWKRAVLYKTVYSDLSDLENIKYDVLVFYSPSGIESLFMNFPNFEQNNTKIAAFGQATIKAAEKAGLSINIPAPTKETPSMTMALERFIQNNNKK